MIDVNNVKTQTRSKIHVSFTGSPDLKTQHINSWVAPDYVICEYVYEPQTDQDGWTRHDWRCVEVSTGGHRVLKTGSDGSQRLGKERRERRWWAASSSDDLGVDAPKYDTPLPEWLVKLVNELRPSGDVTVPGA